MGRRRRKGSGAIGFLIIAGIVIIVLGKIGDALTATTPVFWSVIAAIVGAVVLLRSWLAARERRRVADEELGREEARNSLEQARIARLELGLKRALEIADNQRWVSPKRLSSQVDALTETEAKEVLRVSVARSLLYQAVDGKFYARSILGLQGSPPAITGTALPIRRAN